MAGLARQYGVVMTPSNGSVVAVGGRWVKPLCPFTFRLLLLSLP